MQAQGVWSALESTDSKMVAEKKINKVALAVIYQGIPEDIFFICGREEDDERSMESYQKYMFGS